MTTLKDNPQWGHGTTALLAALILALFVVGIFAGHLGTEGNGLLVWLGFAVILMAILVVVGWGILGRPLGFLIDSRNRMTLARLQMILWTLAILPAFGAVALVRLPDWGTDALDITLPSDLWWLLGLSMTSVLGSPLLLSTKKHGTADPKEVKQTAIEVARLEGRYIPSDEPEGPEPAQGTVLRKATPAEARLHDLFTGEETGNGGYLDVGKVQMFFFTIVLVIAYVLLIGEEFNEIVCSAQFPSPGSGMAQLLGLSHAGYLAHKAVPHSRRVSEAPTAADGSRLRGQQIPLTSGESTQPQKP